jgi:hypothetical protein
VSGYLALPQFPVMSARRRAIAEIGARFLNALAQQVSDFEKSKGAIT